MEACETQECLDEGRIAMLDWWAKDQGIVSVVNSYGAMGLSNKVGEWRQPPWDRLTSGEPFQPGILGEAQVGGESGAHFGRLDELGEGPLFEGLLSVLPLVSTSRYWITPCAMSRTVTACCAISKGYRGAYVASDETVTEGWWSR